MLFSPQKNTNYLPLIYSCSGCSGRFHFIFRGQAVRECFLHRKYFGTVCFD